MTELCHDVEVEPYLYPLSCEVMRYRSAVTDDNARVDIKASGFWRCLCHCTYFDVCVQFFLQPLIGLPPWLLDVRVRSIECEKRSMVAVPL